MKTDVWKRWGARFKEHAREKDLNLAKIAELMDLSEPTLRSWTNGNRKINLEDFFALCAAAELNPATILFGMPIMTETQRNAIGQLATSVLEADPAASPNYKGLTKHLKKAAKSRSKQTVKS